MDRLSKLCRNGSKSLWTYRGGLCLFVLGLATVLLFFASPHAGDFWWSDAPRHAMDGVFYRDLLSAFPIGDPKQFAMDYYLRYPALTILFYPPGFAIFEAPLFWIFGVSHTVAQLAVSLFLLALAWGTYCLAVRWLGRLGALAFAVLLIGTHEVAFWARQVMLEIPAFAFLVWSCYFFLRYLNEGKPSRLYAAIVVAVAGLYTKQTIVFIFCAYLFVLACTRGKQLLRTREVWIGTALFILTVAPLVAFTFIWGHLNIQQTAVGGAWQGQSRLSLDGWLFVARQWPMQVGWPVLVLAVIYAAGAIWRKEWRLETGPKLLIIGWLVSAYVMFSLIAIKDTRHCIFTVFGIVLFAILTILRGLPSKIAPYAALLFACVIFMHTLVSSPIPYVQGYRTAAQQVCAMAAPNSVILFSGNRDGSFVFNVRATPECKGATVIRADKLLLRVAVDREMFGVTEVGITESGFLAMLGRYGVRYVVVEPDFWTDLESMRMLVRSVHGKQFRLVSTIPITTNLPHGAEKLLQIFENLGPIEDKKSFLQLELPVSGISIKGKVGGH